MLSLSFPAFKKSSGKQCQGTSLLRNNTVDEYVAERCMEGNDARRDLSAHPDLLAAWRILPGGKSLVDDVVHLEDGHLNLWFEKNRTKYRGNAAPQATAPCHGARQ